MRTIDADALKKETTQFGDLYGFNPVWQIIDNAPTVEVPNYAMGYQDGVRKVLKEVAEGKHRPQGEWTEDKVAFHFVCNKCGCALKSLKSEVFEGDYNYNFCPNCGVDMKKRTKTE